MFKYEMHLHSSQGSKCAITEGKDYVDFYIANGYSGAVITDHFFHGNTRPERDLPWHQFMDEFLQGYYDMKKASEGKDFDVFFGIEEAFAASDEYLIYGLEPEWFIDHPEIKDMTRADRVEFLTLVKQSGAFIIQAHPFRFRDYFKADHFIIASSFVDGYEVFNSANLPEHNKLALDFAMGTGKIMTSGTDRHKAAPFAAPLGGIELPEKVHSMAELIEALKARKAIPMGIETIKELPDDIEPALPPVLI